MLQWLRPSWRSYAEGLFNTLPLRENLTRHIEWLWASKGYWYVHLAGPAPWLPSTFNLSLRSIGKMITQVEIYTEVSATVGTVTEALPW